MSPHAHGHPDPMTDPTTFWEERYAGSGGIWSGRPNRVLVDEVTALPPGRALDLGSGEGADAVWLAQQGWSVTGIELSPTALRRAGAAADATGVGDRVRWVLADLADLEQWPEEPAYDLVTACFLQTPLHFPRTEVVRRAAGRVAAGGRLLLVAHAAPPPWSDVSPDQHDLFQPASRELADLALGEDWDVEVAEDREREATGPDGQPGALLDSVVLARRER